MIDNYLDTLTIPSDTTVRVDCPVCTRHNTFSVANKQGVYVYNCYSSSCAVSGAKTVSVTLSEIRTKIRNTNAATALHTAYTIPDYWVRGIANESMQDYVRSKHVSHAYKHGLIELMYDPRQDRCVFITRDNELVVNAVGRALNKYTLPKAYVYTRDCFSPFVVGDGGTLVIVEDCASACAITRMSGYCGLALLGTNLLPHHVGVLKRYKHVVVALDKDAARKSLDLQHECKVYNPNTTVWLLRKDIKDMTIEELKDYGR